MTDAQPAVRRRLGDFTLFLPGSWGVVPMTTPEAVRSRAAALVRDRMPRGDRYAALRRDARVQTERTALDALEAGATAFALAFEIAPGVPFGASILALARDWEGPEPEPDALAARLAALSDGGEELPHPTGVLLRKASHGVQQQDGEELVVLELQYWLGRAGHDPALFLVAVPAANAADEVIVRFFDAVVGAVLWRDEAQDGAAAGMGSATHSGDEGSSVT